MSNRSKPHSYSITSSARASSVSGTFEAERALGRGAPVIEIFPTVVLFDICNNVTQTGPGPFTGGKTSLGDRPPPDPGRNAMGLLNIRGDMPVAQPFYGRLQRSSQLPAVLLGHQHGQGIAPRSFQATTETRRAPPPITRLQR